MSNQDVIDLRSAGLDDDSLIAAVKDAQAVGLHLSPAGLKIRSSPERSQIE